MAKQKIRLGIMGFGHIGRHLYRLAMESDDLEIVAICDLGKPKIIHYLLETEGVEGLDCSLDGNYLHNPKFSTRILKGSHPSDVPWDLFGIDFVIDGTRKYNRPEDMQAHLDAGARRVIIAMLPDSRIDRFVIPGINEDSIRPDDRMICAGSATTGALATVLKAIEGAGLSIDYTIMTSVHAYTSDQSLQDTAGEDYRRSRSAAKNIIPNTNLSPAWVEKIMPQFEGRLCGNALNVPVQKGSMLDCTVIFKESSVSVEDVNNAIIAGAEKAPDFLAATAEPIVSSDVIGCRQSVLFDLQATIKSGERMIKAISWYESVGHACRIIDVVRAYSNLGVSDNLNTGGE